MSIKDRMVNNMAAKVAPGLEKVLLSLHTYLEIQAHLQEEMLKEIKILRKKTEDGVAEEVKNIIDKVTKDW
jgi:hypothetical protein